jgi:hypothetical protein
MTETAKAGIMNWKFDRAKSNGRQPRFAGPLPLPARGRNALVLHPRRLIGTTNEREADLASERQSYRRVWLALAWPTAHT